MSGHLPECPDTEPCVYDRNDQCWVDHLQCICEELRACEARLEDEWLNRYNAAEQRGYDAGFRNGVQAARDAVASVPLVMAFTGDLALIRQPVALAAIDALRVES